VPSGRGLPPLSLLVALSLGVAACTGKVEGGAVPSGDVGGSGGAAASTGGSSAASSGGSAGSTGGTANPGAGGTTTSGSGGSTGGAGPGATGGTGGVTDGDPNAAGPMPLRHLTSREYRNTVLALVKDGSLAEDDVPSETSDPTFDYFPFRRPGTVGVVEAESLQLAAEAIVKRLPGGVAALLPCQPGSTAEEASCARTFIDVFGRRAYRRPLSSAEVTRLEALYGEGRTTLGLDFNGAIELLVEALLQAPAFYYLDPRDGRPAEVDPNGQVVKLGGYTLASRLSFFLWGGPPDDALLGEAESGRLATADEVATAARRLASDDRAHEMVADFADDLLDLDILLGRGKDPEVYPAYGLELQESMREEVRRFATGVVFGGDATFSTLLTSTSTFVDGRLAALYGVPGSGDAFTAATLPSAERGGLLSLAGFLANTGSADGSVPPRRGKFVYTRMLCTELPPPPNDVPAVTPPMPGLTTRARFEQHDENPCAAGCHSILDGLGFAFEHYDGIGAYRSTEEGAPVNAATSYAFDEVNPVAFADALELGRVLAAEPLAQACFAKQWLRYALRRHEAGGDTSSLQAVTTTFRSQAGSIPELWVALATSRTFRYRAPASDEVLQ
jgi:hypothetical protein